MVIQQGDVILRPTEAAPANLVTIDPATPLAGTHHTHRLEPVGEGSEVVLLAAAPDGEPVAYRVIGEACLRHVDASGRPGEHGAVVVAAGDGMIERVQEWDTYAHESRTVLD